MNQQEQFKLRNQVQAILQPLAEKANGAKGYNLDTLEERVILNNQKNILAIVSQMTDFDEWVNFVSEQTNKIEV